LLDTELLNLLVCSVIT